MSADLERALRSQLSDLPTEVPSADLFDRVQGSVEADRRRRRQIRRSTLRLALAALLVGAAALPFCIDDGRFAMPWWLLEVLVTVVLIAIALWLGPFIKRFGRAYAADVFHDNPLTGKSYIVLTDIVYYLIFAAYILLTMHLEPPSDWQPLPGAGLVGPDQVEDAGARVGGILLIIGGLHGLNLVLMPVLGRIFSLNRRREPASRGRTDQAPEASGRDTP